MPYRDKDAKKSRDRERLRDKRKKKQDISAQIGPIENPRRRRRASRSLRLFCEIYLSNRFDRPWSQDHLDAIRNMQQTATKGGTFVIAMPRAQGKTALCIALCLWALLNGLRKFVVFIGANKQAALELLDSIKKEIETNSLLAKDFPREVVPFVLLGGEARGAIGQRWKGARTFISWRNAELVFAEIPGSKAAGAIIRVAGITGRIRGMHYLTRRGEQIRPSLAVADDPQDDQSAKSLAKSEFRERVLLSTVGGLAAAGVRIGIVIPCTVIRKGDLADRLTDRALHPDIRGQRTKMLYAIPDNLDLWDQYGRIFTDDRAAGGDGGAAVEFYRAHRQAMDKGAKVAWEHHVDQGELSAVEHAMRWYLFNREGFYAECQQQPLEERIATGRLEEENIYGKLNGRPRLQVPLTCRWITAMIDVNEGLLFYWISAWEPNFSGCRIDWGAWPEQPDAWFTMDGCRKPLSAVYPGCGKEGMVRAGLEALLDKLFAAEYQRDDGLQMPIDLCGIDSRFDQDVVAGVIRAQKRGNNLIPTMGVGFGTASKPYQYFRPEPGAMLGRNWRKALAPKTRLLTLSIDANRWKSFYRDRIRVPAGEPGCYSFCGDPRRPQDEKMSAQHHKAEYPTLTIGPYGEIEIWKHDRGFAENHLWDTAVGACALAATLPAGPRLPEWEHALGGPKSGRSTPRKAVTYL